jgi:uncharacterized protein
LEKINHRTKVTRFALAIVAFALLDSRTENDRRGIFARSNAAEITKLRENASPTNAAAQFDLALRLLTKTNDNAASGQAAVLMQKAAGQNLPDAQFALGLMYDQGRGVDVDKARAGQLILKAAERGLPIAQHAVGNMYVRGLNGVTTNFAEAAKWFRRAADQNYADSQEEIGSLLAAGLGVRQDSVEAAKWWEKAAANGNSTAAFNLGAAYFRGDGVSRDANKAFEWTRKAAEKGYAMAQLSLGRFYIEGWGTMKDPVEALKWFSVGAKNKTIPPNGKLGLAATALIERCKAEMTPEQIKAAEDAAASMSRRE